VIMLGRALAASSSLVLGLLLLSAGLDGQPGFECTLAPFTFYRLYNSRVKLNHLFVSRGAFRLETQL
jgi:hypothetical protein